MNHRTTRSAVALVALGALVAAACSGGDDDTSSSESAATTTVEASNDAATTTQAADESTTTSSASSTSSTTSTTVPDVLRMPLTGEPIDDASEIPDRPALAVKTTNAGPDFMPQSGLNDADVVFEEIINDSVTRLAAVFHSVGADPVGPIRSGRAQDINVLESLQQPLFAWSGGNPAVTAAIRQSDLISISAVNSPGFYRRSGRSSPNNLYSATEALWEQETEDAGRPNPIFFYTQPGESVEGETANRIEVRLDSTNVVWQYDEETDGYFRTQNGRQHTTEHGEDVVPVWVKNVVVMKADYGRNDFDGNPDAQVLGSNPVSVFTGGVVQEGSWLRFMPDEPFQFFDNFDDLNELPIQPGRTWVQIPRNLDDNLSWES